MTSGQSGKPQFRHFGLAMAAGIITIVSACSAAPPAPIPRSTATDIVLPAETVIVEQVVPPAATLDGLLRQHEIPEAVAQRVIATARSAFNLRAVRAGQPYRIVRTGTGRFHSFEYVIDRQRYLRVDGQGDGAETAFTAEIVESPKETITGVIGAAIDGDSPSLVAAVEHAGEQIGLALQLAEVFSGQVDFNADLQPGDRFEALFEKDLRQGEFSGYGPILAATLVTAERRLQAFRVVQPDGRTAYFDENGHSVRRTFLPSPLPFNPRVTSGFSARRLHPVHGVRRAHFGIDYAAAVGTPVLAVADGVVVSAGFSGASGRLIRLRHVNGYESYYLHLSAIGAGVRPGARVSQGDTIGRVGASGVVTGPHLDYRLSKRGVFVNPLIEVREVSPVAVIPASERAAFDVARAAALSQLRRLDDPAEETLTVRAGQDSDAVPSEQ